MEWAVSTVSVYRSPAVLPVNDMTWYELHWIDGEFLSDHVIDVKFLVGIKMRFRELEKYRRGKSLFI